MNKETKSTLTIGGIALIGTALLFAILRDRGHNHPPETAAPTPDMHDHGDGKPHSHDPAPAPKPDVHDHGDGKPHSHDPKPSPNPALHDHDQEHQQGAGKPNM
jgi:hypothetical protein